MPSDRSYDESFADRIVELAGNGLFRDEIARELGVSLADFDAWSVQHPAFAAALAEADTATSAWWNRQPREALATNKPFRAAVWAKVMAQHFGRSGHPPQKRAEPAKPVVRARYNIPDNGMERPPPRGRSRPGT